MESAIAVLIAGLQIGSIYALVALSYMVLINATGILNFGQGEWLMVAAMLGLLFLARGVPYWGAVALSVLGAAALFLACERLVIRPLQNRQTSLMIVITSLLGLMIIIRYGTGLIAGPLALPLEPPFGMDAIWLTENVYVLTHAIFVYTVTLAVFFGIAALYRITWLGRSLTLSAIDPIGAQLVGINPSRVRFIAFALAGLISALVGWLYAPLYAAAFNIGEVPGLKGFIAAVVGGLASPWGALAGGLLLGVVETGASRYLPSAAAEASGFLLLMLILFVRPSGLVRG
jgi:branched-chain amino acid transport system permease protein